MDTILEIFSYPFIIRALIVGILISLCAALLGIILVLKRYSLIGHGLADVGFAALSLALALGLPPLYVSMPIVIVASFFIMMISQKSGGRGDVVIGMVATGALSAGIIITSVTRGFNIDVCNYMFGSILAMSDKDVILSVVLSIVVISLYLLFYNRLFLITYDESYAKACGINVTFYQFLIAFLTALTVVLGMRMMGTLLISSLIIFPAMIAKQIVGSFKAVVFVSTLVSIVCFVIGILISFTFNLPTGASIVSVNIILLLVSISANKIFTLRRA
jgi:zinc transport system permease protein